MFGTIVFRIFRTLGLLGLAIMATAALVGMYGETSQSYIVLKETQKHISEQKAFNGSYRERIAQYEKDVLAYDQKVKAIESSVTAQFRKEMAGKTIDEATKSKMLTIRINAEELSLWRPQWPAQSITYYPGRDVETQWATFLFDVGFTLLIGLVFTVLALSTLASPFIYFGDYIDTEDEEETKDASGLQRD